MAIQKQLAASFPGWPDFRRVLALNYYNLSAVLHATQHPEEAEAALQDALALQRQLAADAPNVPDHQNDLGRTFAKLAAARIVRSEFAEALAQSQQAVAHHEAALKTTPANTLYRECYRNGLGILAESHLGLADDENVAAIAEKLAAFAFDPANDAYQAAGFLSRCVPLAETDRKELAEEYAARAMELLRQAVAHGFADAARLKDDPKFEPLQAREDFKKLTSELEGSAQE
jgi:tetratricopeptide (TPR) repeat protein